MVAMHPMPMMMDAATEIILRRDIIDLLQFTMRASGGPFEAKGTRPRQRLFVTGCRAQRGLDGVIGAPNTIAGTAPAWYPSTEGRLV